MFTTIMQSGQIPAIMCCQIPNQYDYETGKCAGQLILTYEDADGKSYEEEIKFDSEIKETQIKTLKVEDDQEKTNNWWYSIAAVVAVLLISIILILVRKLHKKNILLEEARKAASH